MKVLYAMLIIFSLAACEKNKEVEPKAKQHKKLNGLPYAVPELETEKYKPIGKDRENKNEVRQSDEEQKK